MPATRAGRFEKSIRSAIDAYIELKKRKRAQEIDAELRAIGARVAIALELGYRAAPRHRQFQLVVKDISARLRKLSHEAHDYLAGRGQQVLVGRRSAPPSRDSSRDLVDPLRYRAHGRQIAALLSLAGSLAGPHVRPRGQGRPHKNAERILHAMFAAAFIDATGKAANEKSQQFMTMCDALKERWQLAGYRPESSARGSRPRRKGMA